MGRLVIGQRGRLLGRIWRRAEVDGYLFTLERAHRGEDRADHILRPAGDVCQKMGLRPCRRADHLGQHRRPVRRQRLA